MPNMIFLKKVTGHGHRSKYLYEWEALVTRNLHAKYEGSISNGSKAMDIFFIKVGHRLKHFI